MSFVVWILLFSGIFLNAAAQVFLKFGTNKIGHFEFSFSNILPIAWQVSTNYFIIIGLSCYVFSVILWIMVLSRVAVSIAYPMVAIGYIVTAFAGYFLFNESLTFIKILGILIIIFGVYLVAKS